MPFGGRMSVPFKTRAARERSHIDQLSIDVVVKQVENKQIIASNQRFPIRFTNPDGKPQ
jgi:hypothetical protein